jgi:hypothetical protein
MVSVVRYRLPPRIRKATLVTHVAAAGAWLGLGLALGVLVITTLTADPVGAGAAAASIATFATWPLAAVGLLTLVTGVELGVGSKCGLVRYWWVLVKLVLNIVLVALVLLVLRPGVETLGDLGRAALTEGTPLEAPATLLFPPIVSSTAVLAAISLSVFKPWGRLTRRSPVDTLVTATRELNGAHR